jgi:hypothetical protein
MTKDHPADDPRHLALPSSSAAKSGRPAARTPQVALRQGVTGNGGAPVRRRKAAPGRRDAAGLPFDGLENDPWNPAVQAAGSVEAAADAARKAAREAGGKADPLFTGSPGEEGPAPNIPSSLNLDRRGSAARTGRAEMAERRREHTEASPDVSAGDVDADWVSGEFVGDETPAGHNPTPGMSVVEDVGKAMGVEYQDTEELRGAEKIAERDRHRWELDPASSEDYLERTRRDGKT